MLLIFLPLNCSLLIGNFVFLNIEKDNVMLNHKKLLEIYPLKASIKFNVDGQGLQENEEMKLCFVILF